MAAREPIHYTREECEKHLRLDIARAQLGYTLCPKIGVAQWTCTKDECTCHLKESIGVRHGAAVACAIATPKRLTYEEALKRRPGGACYCDLDDRGCYAAGHWEPVPEVIHE